MKQDMLSLVIPLLNERENLSPLYARITGVLGAEGYNYEIIFIDDGSTDGSLEVLRGIAGKDMRVRVLVFARNYGQTAAMGAGIRHATGSIIVPLDADLQNDPKDIPRLIAKLDEGYDIVSGWRQKRHDEFFRVLLSRIANHLIGRTTGVVLHDYGCTLKAYRNDTVKSIDFFGEMHRLIPVHASWQGAKITEMEVSHHPRRFGNSKYGFSRVGKLILDLLVVKYLQGYSQKPIYFFGFLAFLSFLLGVFSFAFALYLRFFWNITLIQTPLPLFSAMLFLGGLQLFSMGILADTILRTRTEKEQLVYRIKDRIGF